MDPLAIEAKHKYVKPKPSKRPKPPTPFQRELANNPYAHAIAGPVRQCGITRACLPIHFLHPFSAYFEPPTEGRPPTSKFLPVLASDLDSATSSSSSLYFLARASAVAQLTRSGRWDTFVPHRMQEDVERKLERRGKTRSLFAWPEGMGELVAEKLRHRVRKELRRVRGNGDMVPVPVEGESAKRREEVVCVLELCRRGKKGSHSRSVLGVEREVYNLPRLLGEGAEEFGRDEDLAVTQCQGSAKLRLTLMKLSRYLDAPTQQPPSGS